MNCVIQRLSWADASSQAHGVLRLDVYLIARRGGLSDGV